MENPSHSYAAFPTMWAVANSEVWNGGQKGGVGSGERAMPFSQKIFENFMQKLWILVQNFHLFQDASSQ